VVRCREQHQLVGDRGRVQRVVKFLYLGCGDSVVHAHTDPTDGGWPGRLKRASTEAGVTNAVYALGIPGNKLHDVAARFEGEAAARHPEPL
jgi:hypothetical protein